MMVSLDFWTVLIGLVIIIPFLYEFSARFRLFFKFFIYYIVVMTTSVMVIPVIAWRPGNVLNTIIATRPLLLISFLLGLKWELRGVEEMTKDRAAIVVANHQSSLDFLGMVHMWTYFRKISAIAKKEIFYAMPFGLTAYLCGTRFIDRSNPQKAKDSMNAALNYCKEHKVKLWIFPEGTRNMKPEMLSFKKGAFHLAITGQMPIIPVVYSSYTGFLCHRLKIFNPGNVIVTCLPAIETKGLTMDDMPQLMEDVRNKMMKTFTEVSAEVQQPIPLTSRPTTNTAK